MAAASSLNGSSAQLLWRLVEVHNSIVLVTVFPPLLAAVPYQELTSAGWLRRGTPPYITSQTLIEETEQGVHDDVHAVCVTAYDLMCGQAMFDALDDKYQSLSDNVRKGCEAFCQRKLACSAEEVDEGQLLAAAEIHGLVAIEEVRSDTHSLSTAHRFGLFTAVGSECADH